jgi:hypothetical protein
MDLSDECANTSDSIRVNREGDSNKIDESDSHFKKHFDPIISTLFGIKIDWSDDWKKASDPIRVNREGDSNEIDENELQS